MRQTSATNGRWRCVAAAPLVLFMLCGAQSTANDQDDTQGLKLVHGVPEGHMIIEGDIVVPINFSRATYTTARWPSGIIPYQFDTTSTDCGGPCGTNTCDAVVEDATCPATGVCNQTFAENAMAQWEAVANVDFQRCPNDECTMDDFITIRDTTNDTAEDANGNCIAISANNSRVGMVGDEQFLNYQSWGSLFIMVHELGYALGYWHEQSRKDRDTACNGNACIEIEEDNICQNCCSGGTCDHNFEVRTSTFGEYGPYDFDSLMHYHACEFTSCTGCTPGSVSCRTITVLPPNDVEWQTKIGQGDHLSCWDGLGMALLYADQDARFQDLACHCFNSDGCIELGNWGCPYRDFDKAIDRTPCGGTLLIRGTGTYSDVTELSKAMTIRAPLGGVTFCN